MLRSPIFSPIFSPIDNSQLSVSRTTPEKSDLNTSNRRQTDTQTDGVVSKSFFKFKSDVSGLRCPAFPWETDVFTNT